ncbi:sister chromatid cohesion protein DCC1 isoform X3 [Diachasmimorpha longicaudata]|uniref:sister chromatid cohesion protein DCC1 isoform X3 n=1 Tax=Diachasmimorpha longicaudata TaxID=58733 RepID=UPI0030B8823E
MAVNTRYDRSAQQVEETLQLAGISPKKLINSTQVLYSNLKQQPQLDKKKLILVEMDKHLSSCVQEDQGLYFKSGSDGHLVLCSSIKTYEVKEAEMSNSLILIPELKLSEEIEKMGNDGEREVERINVERIFYTYYELRESRPQLGHLLGILGASCFKGIEYEGQIDKSSLYNWERLRNSVQMSDGELRNALSENLVAEIDGHYRLIAFEYEARALTLMLDFMEENSWPPDEIDKEETFEALEELIPRAVFDLIFTKYTTASAKKSTENRLLYAYETENVCQLLAKVLLAASPRNAYDKFMEAWRIGVPETMKPKERYLNGLAVIEYNRERGRKEIVAFPESSLAEEIQERFNQLFQAKDKWTIDEIAPYILRLTTQGSNVTALLTKYARSSTLNGVKYYSSKHGITSLNLISTASLHPGDTEGTCRTRGSRMPTFDELSGPNRQSSHR